MSIERYGAEMEDGDITTFLETHGIGTLAFGDESGGYGIPMSFGYDSVDDRCIFQFAFGDDSTKAGFIEVGTRVTLSAYTYASIQDWQSVVLRGELHRIPDGERAQAAGIFAAHAQIASLEVFREPLQELDLEWYELRIDEKTGRRAVQ